MLICFSLTLPVTLLAQNVLDLTGNPTATAVVAFSAPANAQPSVYTSGGVGFPTEIWVRFEDGNIGGEAPVNSSTSSAIMTLIGPGIVIVGEAYIR